MKISLLLNSVLFFCLVIIHSANGAMVKLTLEKLVQDADVIIVGTVERVDSELADGKIVSFATVLVDMVVKDSLKSRQDKVVIGFPGGIVGEIASEVEDSPNYQEYETVVAFLKSRTNSSYFVTVGDYQGKFLIEDNVVIRENILLDQFLERIELHMK